jgi:hypothetical protein
MAIKHKTLTVFNQNHKHKPKKRDEQIRLQRKTQHKRGLRTHCKSSTIVTSIETISHALRSNENRLVSHNVKTQNTPYSEITDIRAAIESVAPSENRHSDGNHLSVIMSKHNTPYSQITDIRAAIELVAPSVHCRSDGNHLSVASRKHSHLKSPAYMLQSNPLRQACIVVPMEISHNVETQHTLF